MVFKICSVCGASKPINDFSLAKNGANGRQSKCKGCSSEWARNWRNENPEAAIARRKTDYEKHADLYKARAKARYAARRDEIKAKNAAYQKANAEKKAQWEARYRAANLEYGAKRVAERKATKQRAIPTWADRSEIAVLYRKAKELGQKFGVVLHVDHVVPLRSPTVCGLHCTANLQLLSESENVKKSNRFWPDMP